ncbi:MAG: histidine kinase [Flavobacteriaceae bacterium]|nr:histidine kinase [Flavobacteriaceae bacterium]
MKIKQVATLLPFDKLIKLLICLSIGTQLIIILYNNYTGFYPFDSLTQFAVRLIKGSFLSFIVYFFITILNLIAIQYLNKTFDWQHQTIKRIVVQLILTSLIAAAVALPITILVHWITPYPMGVEIILYTNVIIFIIINISTMMILEGWYYFLESTKAKRITEKLQNELSQIRFEVLKSQLNPHFIFNSLNVLSSLIETDVNKSQQFFDEFAQIYRYVLETIEKPVVTLKEELNFIRSYIFLQQIRYGEALRYSVNIPSSALNQMLPPLSLQLVMENVLKHNSISEFQPLHIEVYTNKDMLIVKNNIQQKVSNYKSTGLGQLNLTKRYAMISDKKPKFRVETNDYIVKLPLINTTYYESSYH